MFFPCQQQPTHAFLGLHMGKDRVLRVNPSAAPCVRVTKTGWSQTPLGLRACCRFPAPLLCLWLRRAGGLAEGRWLGAGCWQAASLRVQGLQLAPCPALLPSLPPPHGHVLGRGAAWLLKASGRGGSQKIQTKTEKRGGEGRGGGSSCEAVPMQASVHSTSKQTKQTKNLLKRKAKRYVTWNFSCGL